MAIKVLGTTVIDDSRNIVNVSSISLAANTPHLDINGDIVISGDLTVNGNTTTYNTTSLEIEDNIVHIAKNNNADLIDFGWVGHYISGGANNHAGIFRDATDGKFYAFDSYTADELVGTVVDRTDPSFSLAEFVLEGLNTNSLTVNTTLSIPSNTIGATELNVSGNGTAGQALISDGDGSFSWGAAGATLSDDTTTNAVRYLLWDDVTTGSATSVGVSSTKLTFNPSSGQFYSTEVKTTALKDSSDRTLQILDAANNVVWGN